MEVKLTIDYLRRASRECYYTEYINDKVRLEVIDRDLRSDWRGLHRHGRVSCGVYISEDASLEYVKRIVDTMKGRDWIPQDWPLSLHRESKSSPMDDAFHCSYCDDNGEEDEYEKPKTINELLIDDYWEDDEIHIALAQRTLDVVNDIINALRAIPYRREDGISKILMHMANLTGSDGEKHYE